MTVTTGFGQYLEDALLAWYRGDTFPAVPTSLYLALFTTPPVNGTDAAAVEVSGTAYVRLAVTPNHSNFAAPSGAAPASSSNSGNLVFATPGASWGTVSGWGLYDAAAAGHLLHYGTFAPTAIGSGDTVEFATGNLTLTVS